MNFYKCTHNHPFHIVTVSPWPLYTSFSIINLLISIVIWFHYKIFIFFFVNLIILLIILYQWWRDVIRERTFQGCHRKIVNQNIRLGIFLFIVSEVFFFIGFFWSYFYIALSPRIEIGSLWPPKGIILFNPFDIPLLNTIILISSGFSVTWSHYRLIKNNLLERKLSLLLTIVLGFFFTYIQLVEYKESIFTIRDRVFGSLFYLLTGFHGFHVLIGTLFLLICFIRIIDSHFTSIRHFGFESAIWYWHFVDVVWLFLYILLYCWIWLFYLNSIIIIFNFQLKDLI